ncbi:MAG: hypothetical protein ACJAT7_003769, partial [Psychromonas sp.]
MDVFFKANTAVLAVLLNFHCNPAKPFLLCALVSRTIPISGAVMLNRLQESDIKLL